MDEIKKDNTEERILEAAHNVFLIKGMEGARMQEIADGAGINKALLHYYFRTKEKLFEAIFNKIFEHVFPGIQDLVLSSIPIEVKIKRFIDSYISLLLRNPFLPAFILKEINRDPGFFIRAIGKHRFEPKSFLQIIEAEMEKGNIRKMDPRDLVINILSMCLFPFAGRPVLHVVLFDGNKAAYKEFLEKRKETIKDFVLHSILLK
jgi:AcrR family transcriptional regulator